MDGYVEVFAASDITYAYLLKANIENAGIAVQIENENLAGAYCLDGMVPRVLVPADDVEQARRIIDEIQRPSQNEQDGASEQSDGLPGKYDISIVRPEMREADFNSRGQGMSPSRLREIEEGLRTLHTLELMASNIYRFQITKKPTELNRQLIAAMCNEMTHYQDFTVKLYEYGFRPSCLRWAYWLVGFSFGFVSRLLGERAIVKTGIWVESKAVAHYAELLREIEWDEDTRRIIEKDQADEDGHISRWRKHLEAC